MTKHQSGNTRQKLLYYRENIRWRVIYSYTLRNNIPTGMNSQHLSEKEITRFPIQGNEVDRKGKQSNITAPPHA